MRLILIAAAVKILVTLAVWPWTSPPAGLPASALPSWYYVSLLLAFGVSGGLLYSGGKGDARARALGLALLLFATLFADRLLVRSASSVHDTALAWLPSLASLHLYAFEPLVLWYFAWSFPRVQAALVHPWLHPVVSQMALAAGVVLMAGSATIARLASQSRALATLGARLSPNTDDGWFWQICSILIVPSLALLVAKLRAASSAERRRLRWVVAGIVVGSFPMVVHVLLATTVPPYADFFAEPRRSRTLGIALTAISLVIPAATAYAVLVAHVLQVRFVVRRAVQYALARYTVLALMLGTILGLIAVGYGNRARPIGEILTASPTTMLAPVLLAAVLFGRRSLLEAIDRRFFREQYDARRILVELVDMSRKAETARDIVNLITSEVDRALHLERICLLLRDAESNHLVDPQARVRSLDMGGALGSLIEGSPAPLDVDLSSDGSPLGRLPGVEREWLADAGARLIVPLLGAGERPLGILTLGDKRSELPFTREDRQLVAAVAASAAVALEQRLRRESPNPDVVLAIGVHAAHQCVNCGRVQDRQLSACRACHGALREALLPAVLAGKYEIERQIGAGGMGVVYRALDLGLGRPVAVKVLPRIGPQATSRLRREARAMATLQHQHLAVIHSMESWRGAPVLVMEYLPGGTVAERIRGGTQPVQDVVVLGLVIGDVLHHVHRAGYLHRDVKPSNIGFSGGGVAKLLDFGLVRLVASLSALAAPEDTTATAGFGPNAGRPMSESEVTVLETPINRLIGTPAYLSPEVVAMAYPSEAADLWALAVTLYEALTGQNPFRAPTVEETVHRIARANVPDPRGVRPDCPPALAGFLASALAANVRLRPQTALEFRDRLDAAGGGWVDRRPAQDSRPGLHE